MKNPIQNQKGIALIATLMLLVLGFAVVAILFRLTTQETKLARLEQGYATALDAAKGATDLFIFLVQNGRSTPPNASFGTSLNQGRCLQVKMANATSSWSTTTGWNTAPACPSQADATSTDPTISPDITLALSGYTVNVKVIDNTLTEGTGSTPCYNGCFYYTVVSRAQGPGSSEHADIFFVYRYDR